MKKIVLAYSGGLDTSVILKWLQITYNCPVVTFTADIGQGDELEPIEKKAKSLGVKEIYIEDLQEEFVKEYVFPMFRANTIYEGSYLLGTAIARPLIAKRQIEIANEVGADAVAHGATGKGNDQVRFELGYYANNPKINVIAPWRDWEFSSRTELLNLQSFIKLLFQKIRLVNRHLVQMQIYYIHLQKESYLKTHGLNHHNMFLQELAILKILQIITKK